MRTPVRRQWSAAVVAAAILLPLPAAGAAQAAPQTPSPPAPSVAAAATPAVSARLAAARVRAAKLNATVDRLRLRAEQSTEAYDAALDEVTQLKAGTLASDRNVDQLAAAAARVQAGNAARVRLLYQSQGEYGVLGALFAGGAPDDLLDRAEVAATVVEANQALAAAAGAGAREGADIAGTAEASQQRQVKLAATAAEHAGRVRQALATADATFADADADVRRIAEADRKAVEAASARAFAAALAAAQRAAAERVAAQAALLRQNAAGSGVGSLLGTVSGPPAPTAAAAAALTAAGTRLGMPYLWGAVGPTSFDCSGLTGWSYRQAGVFLPRTSGEQWNAGPHPTLAELAPGDLLFWATDNSNPATIHHVALYLGNGQMIAAPHSGDVVKVQPVYGDGFIGAVRPTAA
jgi:cell wall-associated NlpC family hydrolase